MNAALECLYRVSIILIGTGRKTWPESERSTSRCKGYTILISGPEHARRQFTFASKGSPQGPCMLIAFLGTDPWGNTVRAVVAVCHHTHLTFIIRKTTRFPDKFLIVIFWPETARTRKALQLVTVQVRAHNTIQPIKTYCDTNVLVPIRLLGLPGAHDAHALVVGGVLGTACPVPRTSGQLCSNEGVLNTRKKIILLF